jgi:hypothetical protein
MTKRKIKYGPKERKKDSLFHTLYMYQRQFPPNDKSNAHPLPKIYENCEVRVSFLKYQNKGGRGL